MKSLQPAHSDAFPRLEMTIPTEINPATRLLAARLVAVESEAQIVASEDRLVTCRVCEKLRRPLGQLVGVAGFSTLLQRALTLARRESPTLSSVTVQDDGSMLGLDGAAAEASPVLVAHLTHLLMTFIGEGLTVTLLQDTWPEVMDVVEPSGKDGL